MDLSVLLSVVAIVVSALTSGITLLLTQFQGPDISLISSPEFEVNDDHLETRLKDLMRATYIPTWFDLEKIPFVFANHGGKSGTILSIDCQFSPTEEFRKFFGRFHSNFTVLGEENPSSITTIKNGDNKTLIADMSFQLTDWKKAALARALDPALRADDMVSEALQRSKKTFAGFCDFLKEYRELGKINCTISFTKGRFRTKVVKECLLKDVTLYNRCDHSLSSLRDFLQTWENRELTRSQLLNELKKDLDGLARELKDNLTSLNTTVQDQNISGLKLHVDSWKQLCSLSDPIERKIRWFLIRSDDCLDQKLAELYSQIERYNSLVDDAIARSELTRAPHLGTVNRERKQLSTAVQSVLNELSQLYLRYIS